MRTGVRDSTAVGAKEKNSGAPSFASRLIAWQREHGRHGLPWQNTTDPYRIWLAEIMLQQTQVRAVVPYYQRFLVAFPDLPALAHAPLERVLELWSGLGYYSRARNLHRASQVVVDEYDGLVPNNRADLLKLPGIGAYTAGAILSLAYGQTAPIVDGNVIRVLARLSNDPANTREPKIIERYWQQAKKLIPLGQARNFNQAMMEFGALVCTPKNPTCESCPVQSVCEAYKKRTIANLPNRGPSAEKIPIRVALAVIRHPHSETDPAMSNKFFIQKRQQKGLMGGLWEFPGGKVEPGETPEQALHREIREELGITLKNPRSFMKIKHAYTRYTVDLHCFIAEQGTGKIQLTAARNHRWVTLEEMGQLAFPAANVKLIRHFKVSFFY